MRQESKRWDFIDKTALFINTYVPIDENKAKITGLGKIYNDQVKVRDIIEIKTKNGKCELFVEEITYTSNSGFFEAIVTLGYVF
jgi:hypothetical protein